jgi:peptidoglycan/LPS O-acetylase OafA/YrhL
VAVLAYLGNWKIVYADGWPPIAPGLAHLWSLAVEEQFYLLWPLITAAVVGRRRSLRSVTAILVSAIVAVAVWRVVLTHGAPRGVVYFRTDARADALLVGALAAHWWVRGRIPPIPRAFATTAALLLVAAAVFVDATSPLLFNGGFTLLAVVSAIVLISALDGDWPARRGLRAAPLRGVGRVSYGLYLWHYPVLVAVAEHGERWSVGARLVVSGVVIVAAVWLSRRFVELPFLRLKDRLERPEPESRMVEYAR